MRDALIDPLLHRWVFPMVMVGRRFELPYGAARRRELARNGTYAADFGPFLKRVLRAMRDPMFPPGSYFPAGWYRALLDRGVDPAQAHATPEALAPFYRPELRVDGLGRWWSGEKHIKGRVLRFFLNHLQYEPGLGLYAVRYPLEQIEEAQYVHHESPPLRVERLLVAHGPPSIELNDGTVEPLRAESLWLDRGDRLYCSVKWTQYSAGLIAAIDDPARWDLLSTLENEDGTWFVRWDGERREIPVRD